MAIAFNYNPGPIKVTLFITFMPHFYHSPAIKVTLFLYLLPLLRSFALLPGLHTIRISFRSF